MKIQTLACMILIILVAGCVSQDSRSVAPGDKVSVHYTGTLDDGTVFDSSEGKSPIEFTAGAGEMIKGFDAAVIGMRIGETKNVHIKAQDAYGNHNPDLVQNVSKSQFEGDVPPAGSTVYSSRGPVKVVAVYENNVTINFNHELAGRALNFKITLVSIE